MKKEKKQKTTFTVQEIANAILEVALDEWGSDIDGGVESIEEVLKALGVQYKSIKTDNVTVVF
jgi:hypothetical protein